MRDNAKTITVAICTRNKDWLLPRTLDALGAMLRPHAWVAEILVVDNASTDGTRDVVEEFQTRFPMPLHYVQERSVGLSAARNRAIREANGDIIAFLDDDAFVSRDWLVELCNVFEKHPEAACVTGRITLEWEVPPPRWVSDTMWSFFGYFDMQEQCSVSAGDVRGGNMAFPTDIFEELGLFRCDLGYRGGALVPGEETELCQRIEQDGRSMVFSPRIEVRHFVPARKATWRYVLRRSVGAGLAKAYLRSEVSRPSRKGERFLFLLMETQKGLRRILRLVARRWIMRRPLDARDFVEVFKRIGFAYGSFRQ